MTQFTPVASEIEQAARALHRGELVAFPTETVYGLGADADQDASVEHIFALKGRPNNHPLIVHIGSLQDVDHYARDVPDFARALMARFWPGALTLILPKRIGAAPAATAHSPSIGLRWPSHPVALALLQQARALGVHGVAAPSANRFGRVSPTRAAHVRSEFGPDLWVLDGGDCDIGIESTIVDCTRGVPIVLRPGQIDQQALEAALNQPVVRQEELDLARLQSDPAHLIAPKASGTLASHYAPRARVRLMEAAQMVHELTHWRAPSAPERMGASPPTLGVWARDSALHAMPRPKGLHFQAMPSTPAACAHALFATLRDFDDLGVAEIWIESAPSGVSWAGVADRLRRASHVPAEPSQSAVKLSGLTGVAQ